MIYDLLIGIVIVIDIDIVAANRRWDRKWCSFTFAQTIHLLPRGFHSSRFQSLKFRSSEMPSSPISSRHGSTLALHKSLLDNSLMPCVFKSSLMTVLVFTQRNYVELKAITWLAGRSNGEWRPLSEIFRQKSHISSVRNDSRPSITHHHRVNVEKSNFLWIRSFKCQLTANRAEILSLRPKVQAFKSNCLKLIRLVCVCVCARHWILFNSFFFGKKIYRKIVMILS